MTEITITSGLWDHLAPAYSLLSHVFDHDPVLRYIFCDVSDEDFLRCLRPFWRGLFRTALLNGGVIYQVDGWKTAGVLLPPGKSVDNLWMMVPAAFGFTGVFWRIGIYGLKRMLRDYSHPVNAAKKRVLEGQEHYYLFALGTEYEHQRKGLAKALIDSFQQTAWCLERPIWLEATTEHSRDVFLALHFEVAEEITLGENQVAADGRKEPGGPGVTLWAMVWWPKECATR
ncbi:hypothetical protein BJX99DRAFT_225870 [Aspergillus californicus]